MTDREKPVNILSAKIHPREGADPAEVVAEYLLDSGVVPVVRCRECRHHTDEEPGMVYCPLMLGGWRENGWYCADGERREEDAAD